MMTAEALYRLRICGDKRERKKLIKKRSSPDITIHFKQIEDSEDNSKHKNNSPGASSQESERERETVIRVDNGTTSGPKKRFINKGEEEHAEP
ncbi:hypothetical protein HID58_057863 [Brassica napus]|uniref:Uncharacterized protein n=1 Tax=Brassica napus TaxID=3708 RepID=A0ABQ7ZNY6_BRANA|nr:hypothetical protein HID58_057863 [Brassica napus]